MKASIVIANYNNSKYIDNCINSLNSQTYDNIEIIFFDPLDDFDHHLLELLSYQQS